MKRVLFVDDEPMILEGLQRMLRSQRREWEMSFAVGGAAALAELAAAPFDAVVTDMRMPAMDGAELLAEVQQRYPATVRIILSGHSDPEATARATRVAHQFLSKPCSAEDLKAAVNRSVSRKDALGNEAIRGVVGAIDNLPMIPALYLRMSEILSVPEPSVTEATTALAQDVGMCAKLLQVVNSSFVGIGRRVTSIRTAVELLGIRVIRDLVLSAELSRAFEVGQPESGFSSDTVHTHSLRVATLASEMVTDATLAEDAYTIGLLHDVGKLVLANRLPVAYGAIMRTAQKRRSPLHLIELEELGVTHADVGAYLLGLWSLPDSIVQAVEQHHASLVLPSSSLDLNALIALANELINEAEAGTPRAGLLEHAGIADRLPELRALAARQIRIPSAN